MNGPTSWSPVTHLNAALRLAGLGWHVFALGPTGHPLPRCRACKETCLVAADYERCDHLVCHATYAGTTDPERVEAMWGHFPNSIIGVRTGEPSGIIALDFDLHSEDKNGETSFDMLEQRGLLRQTVAQTTGGGGLHLIYRHPGVAVPNDNRGKLAPGVDIKSDGGFIIVAPSAKRGKLPYSWVPGLEPWNYELASLPEEVLLAIVKVDKPMLTSDSITLANDDESVTKRYNDALDVLRTTGLGSRNENLYRAACRGGEVVAAELHPQQHVTDLLHSVGIEAGLAPGEVQQTVRSGLNRGFNDYFQEI